jgi:hypothetical protein
MKHLEFKPLEDMLEDFNTNQKPSKVSFVRTFLDRKAMEMIHDHQELVADHILNDSLFKVVAETNAMKISSLQREQINNSFKSLPGDPLHVVASIWQIVSYPIYKLWFRLFSTK